MTDKKPNPIEEAIGERAKDPKALEKFTKEYQTEPIPLSNSHPSEIPDEPSPTEMLDLEELNRQTEERLREPDEIRFPKAPVAKIITPKSPIPASKPDPPPETENCSPESPPQKVEIFVDGAVRDNYKRAAIGCIIKFDGVTKNTISKEIGPATNNEAEYLAFIAAAEMALDLGLQKNPLFIFSDSELLVKQINGLYKVKSPGILPLYQKASKLAGSLYANVRHIPREQNKEADVLANNALTQLPEAKELPPLDTENELLAQQDDRQKHVETFNKTAEMLNIPAEDIELTALRKYIFEDGFVVATVAFHVVTLCAQPMVTPSTTTWDFVDRAIIPEMVFALLKQPGYLEGIWPSLKIVMGSNKGNSAWCSGIAITIAFFDIIRTLPTLKGMKNEEKS